MVHVRLKRPSGTDEQFGQIKKSLNYYGDAITGFAGYF